MRFGSAYFPVARCRRALFGIFRFVTCVEESGNREQYKVQYTVDRYDGLKLFVNGWGVDWRIGVSSRYRAKKFSGTPR